MKQQHGVSMSGLLIVLVIAIVCVITAFRLIPAYIEYFTIKKDIAVVSKRPDLKTATVGQVRQAFDTMASVDDVHSISGADLDISKDGSDWVISFSYPRKVALGGNLSLLIDFAASSAKP